MAFFRVGETVNITKVVGAGSSILVESDYSLIIRHSLGTKVIPESEITFTLVQPTSSSNGSISCSFTITAEYSEGTHIFELHQIIPGGDTWTRKIGTARAKIEKYPVAVLEI